MLYKSLFHSKSNWEKSTIAITVTSYRDIYDNSRGFHTAIMSARYGNRGYKTLKHYLNVYVNEMSLLIV